MPTTVDAHAPWDGVASFEADWREMFRAWLRSGVMAGLDNELLVYGDSSGRQVKVKTGRMRIEGHYGKTTSEKILAVTANSSGNPRIDRCVMRADFTNNRIELDILAGTPGVSPSAPALTQSASVYEFSLAKIGALASGYTTIAAGDVTDERALLSSYGVPSFADANARDLWVPSPVTGFEAFLRSTLKRVAWDGTTWRELAALGAWDTYTPTLTNITLGNGTVNGKYRLVGRTCHFVIRVVWGSTTAQSATPAKISLPVARAGGATTPDQFPMRVSNAAGTVEAVGVAFSNEASNISRMDLAPGAGSSGTPTGFIIGGFLDEQASSVPFNMGTGDYLAISGTYETT